MNKTVYIVHCVDTEGPLFESLEAKYERLKTVFGITNLEKTQGTLEKLKKGAIPLQGKEELIKQIFSSHLANYMDNWEKLEQMLLQATKESFRSNLKDSFGGSYKYSWFCLDHVGYVINPRKRTLGFHAIFDYYNNFLNKPEDRCDGMHWHFHPMSIYKEAHRCATSLLNSPLIIETLARRIIEREWFPSSVRCGFQTERPDIHWFLEQYIPFDFTNTSLEDDSEQEEQADLANGRFLDWRLATKDWRAYHPSHDNYQLPGNCRRLIARALNVLNRFGNLTKGEVEKAFIQANNGEPALLAIASHDFRDLRPEVDFFRNLIVEVAKDFPDVKFKFCDAKEAMQNVVYEGNIAPALELKLNLEKNTAGLPHVLTIETVNGKIFGPQPFFAAKLRSQRFIHDNFDFSLDQKTWRYVFDEESILPDDVEAIGIGANDKYGNTFVKTITIKSNKG